MASGYAAQPLDAVESVNDGQKHVLAGKIAGYFGADLSGKTIAVWGLAKPNMDDMREASSRDLIEDLWAAGAGSRHMIPWRGQKLCESMASVTISV